MTAQGVQSLPQEQATAAELANLSISPHAVVRAAVAVHPNTSPAILGALAAEFPEGILRNPALPLLRLADPLFMQRWPEDALLALTTCENVPGWLRKQRIGHPRTELQVALASHPAITPEEMGLLAQHPAWLVRARVAARSDLPPELRHKLMQDSDYGVRLALASRSDLPAQEVALLQQDVSRFVRQEVQRQLASPE